MTISTTKTPSEVIYGNPPSSANQPAPSDVVQILDDVLANGAASSDLTGLDTRVSSLETLGATGAQYTAGGPVACATTANITLSGEQTLDGVTTSTDRVLVKNQTDPEGNGIYVSAAGAWARATDMDAAAEVNGTLIYVSAGTANGMKTFVTYSAVTTLGTDAVEFREADDASSFSSALALKADAADAVLTGTPTAPTATSGTDTTQIATTAFVVDAVAGVDVFSTSYSNTDGQGDRTSTISVATSDSLLYGASAASSIVNGVDATGDYDNAIRLAADALSNDWIRFDFGLASARVVQEVTWKVSSASNSMSVKWQGSNDASTWTDLTSSESMTGSTTYTFDLSSNTTPYRYYRILLISGTPILSVWHYEVTFKIAAAITDGFAIQSGRFPDDFPTSKLVDGYFFDEVDDSDMLLSVLGRHDVDISGGSNWSRTRRGIRIQSGLVTTAEFTGARAYTLLYRADRGGTPGYITKLSTGTEGIRQQNYATPGTMRVAAGGLDMHDPAHNTSTALGCYILNRGGWVTAYHDYGSTASFGIHLGSKNNAGNFCVDLEVNCLFVWNAVLTTDEEAAVMRFIRARSSGMGVFIHRDDCPDKGNDLYLMIGESNCEGRATLANVSASDQALDMRHTLISASGGGSGIRALDKFELGFNHQVDAPTLDMGPEFGVAKQRRSDYLTTATSGVDARAIGKALIVKIGNGGTHLAPSSVTGVNAAGSTWNVDENGDTGLFYLAMRHVQDALQQMMTRGIGYRDTVRIGLWIGLNDSADTAMPVDAATYQGYLQDLLDRIEELLPGLTVEMTVFRPHNSYSGSDATALGYIRTACDAFATANSNVTSVDTDALGLEASDGFGDLHYNPAANITMGATLHG